MSLDKIYFHEETYLIGLKDYYRISRLARELLLSGEHDNPAESHEVRSLYFDAMARRIYGHRNSADVVKLRVHDSLHSQVELIFREKTNGVLRREQLPVSREDALRIINGDFSFFTAYGSDSALHIYGFLMTATYRPDVMVECSHIVYEFPAYQARIVFKTNVRAGCDPMKFFETGACVTPALPEDIVILRAEYNFTLPPIFRSWIDLAGGEKLEGSEYEYLRGRLKPVATISEDERVSDAVPGDPSPDR